MIAAGLLIAAVLAATDVLPAAEEPLVTESGCAERLARLWLGDGRHPPVRAGGADNAQRLSVRDVAPNFFEDAWRWWLGDGSHPPS